MLGGLLFVCYANMCRSAMAEYIAREMLVDQLGVVLVPVHSAGTHATPGRPMHPYAAQLAVERGIAADGFRSRPLTAEDLTQAGVILAATRQQRTECVALAPSSVRRTFTLRQFARLSIAAAEGGRLTSVPNCPPVQRLTELLNAAAWARGQLQPAPPAADDLVDPVGQPIAHFRQCARTIEQALSPIIRYLRGDPYLQAGSNRTPLWSRAGKAE